MQSAPLLHRPAHDHGAICRMCGHQATDRAGNVDGYDLRACGVCAFAFVPAVTQDNVGRRRRGIPIAAPGHGGTDAGLVDIVRPHMPRQAPLEILGFGDGLRSSTTRLQAEGHRITLVNIEGSTKGARGHRVGLGLTDDRFDLTLAHQAFEHLPEPRRHLDELLRVTKPGGLLLVHTDMETPERDGGLTSWSYVKPPNRCSFFRHQTFHRYLQGTPHRIVHLDATRVLVRRG